MEFQGLLSTLSPILDGTGVFILSFIIATIFAVIYRFTKSRQLLNSLPGLFTSLGLLGTFVAICNSLGGIDSMQSPNVLLIIQKLIPAFTSSIAGLIAAFIATTACKIWYSYEEKRIDKKVENKTPEECLFEVMNNTSQTHASIEEVVSLLKQKAAKDEEYNQKLNDSISQQSKILEDFINKFVVRMEEIFTKMQGNIEQQIQDFGEDQFKKTSAILTEITQKLSDSSTTLIAKQEQSVTEMIDRTNEGLSSVTTTVVQQVDKLCADTTSALQDISAKQREDFSGIIEKYGDLAQRLTQQGADGLQQMEELKQTYQSANASMLQSTTDMNNEITAGFRSSISTLIADMQALIRQQVESLSAAITNSVQTLQQSYDYIDNHMAHIKGNYDSSAQSFEDAMKLAHRHNEASDKLVKTFNESIGAVVETNEKIDNVLSVLVERQENIESLIVKINQIGETIELLQKLELQLNRIASK